MHRTAATPVRETSRAKTSKVKLWGPWALSDFKVTAFTNYCTNANKATTKVIISALPFMGQLEFEARPRKHVERFTIVPQTPPLRPQQ